MGILRFLLAISVVTAHVGKLFNTEFVGGTIAVQTFYIISGFYMSLILNEKYIGYGKIKLFITNRFLRLYPVYWVVLLLTVISSIVVYLMTDGTNLGKFRAYGEYFDSMSILSLAFLLFSNIFLFFQDIVMFLALDVTTGQLFFVSDFRNYTPQVASFLFIPQAWTIGLELTFYLLAPFIVRRKPIIILLLISASLTLRYLLYKNGLNHDPWTYRFFFTEFAFFLFGTLAYNIYKKIEGFNIQRIYTNLMLIFIITLTVFYEWLPFEYNNVFYFFIFFAFLPFIFLSTKTWKRDSYIGELSYPIYISHMLIIYTFSIFKVNGYWYPFSVILCCIIFSILLNETISKKIEKIRQARVRKNL